MDVKTFEEIKKIEEDYPADYLRAIAMVIVFSDLELTTKIEGKEDFLNRINAFNNHEGEEFDRDKIISICEDLADKDEKYDFLRFYFDFLSTEIENTIKPVISEQNNEEVI